MSRFRIALGAFVAVLALVAGLSTAEARHRGDGTSLGIYLGPDEFGLFLGYSDYDRRYHRRYHHYDHDWWSWDRRRYNRHRYDYWYDHHYGRDYHYGHWYGEPRYFYRDRYRYHARGCHPVIKIGYHRGHRVKIRATMCYRHGHPYIVAGSRRIVGYY